jgi:hypothetical protein
MALVNIDPNSGKYAQIRHGGNEADCEIVDYVHDVEPGDGPAYDRDCDRGPYCLFVFRVTEPDQVVYHREYQGKKAFTRSKALKWIQNSGCPVDDEGNFDDDQLKGLKVALEFAEPTPGKKDPTQRFTKVLDVIGLDVIGLG